MAGDHRRYDELLVEPWPRGENVRLDFVRLQCVVAIFGNGWALQGRQFRTPEDFLDAFRSWENFLSPAVNFDLAATIVHSSAKGEGLGVTVTDYWDFVSGPALTVTALGAFSLLHCPEMIGDWRKELWALTSFYRRNGHRRLISFFIRSD